uniref:E3 ubiquitin-protein ligase RNF135-like n=1 Tax=Geotrypetes seraphini TaxID=260995 RepID=A0A6P8SG45_GEOSA|nr:E3 ubiquitin-protein ligase RNF135-like [Geotrypetes seraphini]
MAAREVLVMVSAKDLECSICLSYFDRPCTLGCGHNFCISCIEMHWSPPPEHYKCPLCQRTWRARPALNKNTELTAMVEKVRASAPPAVEPPCCAGPGARVLCLTCARAFCPAHGRPHLEEGPLGAHVLVKPLEASWPCGEHAQALQYFCASHGLPVCPSCVGQHPNCRLVPLLQEFLRKQEHMKTKLNEVILEIERKEVAISRWNEECHRMNCSLSENKALLTESFQDMKKYLEELEYATIRKAEEEREQGQRELEDIINTLTEERDKLKDFKAKRQGLLQDDWLELLKGQPQDEESCAISPSKPENLVFHSKVKSLIGAVEKLKQDLLEKSILEDFPLQEKQEQPVELLLEHSISALSLEDPNKPVVKGLKLQQFSELAAPVTFDPETINSHHSLSDENKTISVLDVKRCYPPAPRRFTISQALGCQSFDCGRHYWEVNTKDSEGWAIGVTEGKIGKHDLLGRNDFSWCVEWSNKQLLAWHRSCSTLLTQAKPQTVGILLDCESRALSFYSADDGILLHRFESHFQGPFFPAFWLNGLGVGEHLTIT